MCDPAVTVMELSKYRSLVFASACKEDLEALVFSGPDIEGGT
jgi:hypothetical protein